MLVVEAYFVYIDQLHSSKTYGVPTDDYVDNFADKCVRYRRLRLERARLWRGARLWDTKPASTTSLASHSNSGGHAALYRRQDSGETLEERDCVKRRTARIDWAARARSAGLGPPRAPPPSAPIPREGNLRAARDLERFHKKRVGAGNHRDDKKRTGTISLCRQPLRGDRGGAGAHMAGGRRGRAGRAAGAPSRQWRLQSRAPTRVAPYTLPPRALRRRPPTHG
ncbi:hypothetical protein EVAR_39271_1 [Eumeta japonica]|uniref:Uncharacterized protein n=1 Tax=Eumeta variegata TaxID=151549 RepID=A0A4C1VZ51_EUMVA|nr:hypothetical protein EVAR_39271_1 [Eumeta japonica]